MKHQAVNYGQDTVNAIDGQQDNPTKITGLNYKLPYQEKKNESNTHRTYITGKALRLLAEIEETEDKDRTNHGIDKVLFYKRRYLLINKPVQQVSLENSPR